MTYEQCIRRKTDGESAAVDSKSGAGHPRIKGCPAPHRKPGQGLVMEPPSKVQLVYFDIQPKSFPKPLPPLFALAWAISSAVCLPGHHWEAGTWALTESMCWPHPAQVVFPQTEQVTGRHISVLLSSGWCG